MSDGEQGEGIGEHLVPSLKHPVIAHHTHHGACGQDRYLNSVVHDAFVYDNSEPMGRCFLPVVISGRTSLPMFRLQEELTAAHLSDNFTNRSADFQSAGSQACSLRGVGKSERAGIADTLPIANRQYAIGGAVGATYQ